MGQGSDEIDGSRGIKQSGLRRLMLKQPALRVQLQALAASPSACANLFEAYDEACLALERFRRDPRFRSLVEEYETVCQEIEASILCDIR